tara:strand:+ start:985 stop:1374 length:390 start_codon:yes stop_codon:yes gene_type:complete
MKGNINSRTLQEREQRIIELISDLERELFFIRSQLADNTAKKPPLLTERFFFDNLYLLLKEKEGGLFSKEIYKYLKSFGYEINDSTFRLFIFRMKKKGYLELRRQTKGAGRWKLTPKAQELHNERMRQK